jgi:hypothetical protein
VTKGPFNPSISNACLVHSNDVRRERRPELTSLKHLTRNDALDLRAHEALDDCGQMRIQPTLKHRANLLADNLLERNGWA